MVVSLALTSLSSTSPWHPSGAHQHTRSLPRSSGSAAIKLGCCSSHRRYIAITRSRSPSCESLNGFACVFRAKSERGRIGWQKALGYNWRALVESDIARWKRVIGDGLRSHTDGRQVSEVAIAADVLNRMLDLGRPEYVRTA